MYTRLKMENSKLLNNDIKEKESVLTDSFLYSKEEKRMEVFVLFSHLKTLKAAQTSINSLILSLEKCKEKVVTSAGFNSSTQKLTFILEDKLVSYNKISININEIEYNTIIELSINQYPVLAVDLIKALKQVSHNLFLVELDNRTAKLEEIKITEKGIIFLVSGVTERTLLIQDVIQEEIKQSNKDNGRFLIIDGNNLLFRSYYSSAYQRDEKDLEVNSKGEYINGIKVFMELLGRYLKKYKPTHLAVCWDNSHNPFLQTFRKKLYAAYKQGRSEKPKALLEQLDTIKKYLTRINIPQFIDKSGEFESDDLVGTFISLWKEKMDGPVFIVSNDKDFYQLLNDNVYQVYNNGKEWITYSYEDFQNEYLIPPSSWVDAKALMGDKSDNLPGCIGVGPKAIFPLLMKYKSLEQIYLNINEIQKSEFKRYAKKLEEGKENAYLTKKLAEIVKDVPFILAQSLEDTKINFSNEEKKLVFTELGLVKTQIA